MNPMKITPTIEEIKSFARESKWLFLGSQVTDNNETVYRWLTPSGNQVTLTYHQEKDEILHIKIDNT